MDWKKIKAKFDSNCKTCGQPTNTGFDVLWKKGLGVIHLECDKPDQTNIEHTPQPFCHECNRKLIFCGEPDCMLCKFGYSFCPACQIHVSVNKK